jgi:ABC-type proline/glycine betaine transport system permease subunit
VYPEYTGTIAREILATQERLDLAGLNARLRPLGLEAGTPLSLSRKQILRSIEIPLALPTIVAGVKTSAVISVGTATIAAFIGAGGFGERISQGLALVIHVLFEVAEPAVSRGLART